MASKHVHLPEELLVKIFIPQTVKCLLQLRSVCKFWYEVISSDLFVKSHLAHQKTSLNTNKYLQIRYGTSSVTTLVDGDDNILESHKIDMRGNINGIFPPYDRLECYGICDGLVCLSYGRSGIQDLNSDSPIYLWNPILRKVKKLPRMKKSAIWDIKDSYLCFGHHDDDYKVIKVIPLPGVYKVHIYSFSQDSWNTLELKKKDNYHHADEFDLLPYVKARFVNGAAFFVETTKELARRVVCFDLNRKIIRHINLPDDFSRGCNYSMEEYQDSIALLHNISDNEMVMWGLRMSDNSYEWNKMFISTKLETPAIGKDMGALGFVNKDKVVLRMIMTRNSDYECFLFNLENKSEQPVTTPVDKRGIKDVRLYDLTESLVLLANSTSQKMQPCSANEENQKSRKRKSFCC